MTDQPANLDLDDIEGRVQGATKAPWFATKDGTDTNVPVVFVNRTSPKGVAYSSVLWNADWATEADAEFTAHAPADMQALLAEVHRLRARVAELEGPAVEARAALAALCYDLEDPGSNAFGALYLISQATVGVDAPKDDAALALGKHAAQVLHRVADMADPEPPELSFFGGMTGPTVAAWLQMLAGQPKSVETLAAP